MAYNYFDRNKPDGSVDTILEVSEHVRRNDAAIVDAINSGGAYPGVDQVLEGPDPAYPARVIYQGSSGVWIKKNITWTDGVPTFLLYERSVNGGTNWSLLGDKTIHYDAAGNVTGTTWNVNVNYKAYDPTLPDSITQNGPEITPSIRGNHSALADAIILEGLPGWDMTVNGDPALPTELIEINQDDTQQRLKTAIVYNADTTPQTITYSRSSDGGTNWDLIGTKNISYDGNGNVLAVTWS